MVHRDDRDAKGVQETLESPDLELPKYLSAKFLAAKWSVSVSSIGRIARREKFRRLCLGTGRAGSVRYLAEDVRRFEERHQI